MLSWEWVYLLGAAGILGVLIWRKQLGEGALNRGPTRDLDLSLGEAYIGAAVGALSLLLMGLPAIMALVMRPSTVEGGYRKIGLVPRWPGRDVMVALIAVPAAIILASATAVLAAWVGQVIGRPYPDQMESGHQTLEVLKSSQDLTEILWILVFAGLLAPLFEELSVRGVMQTSLLSVFGRQRRWLALAVTAVFFGLIHYSAVTTWHAIPPLIVLGLVFGYVYERTGSLLCSVLVHAGFNAYNLGVVLAMRFV